MAALAVSHEIILRFLWHNRGSGDVHGRILPQSGSAQIQADLASGDSEAPFLSVTVERGRTSWLPPTILEQSTCLRAF
jgi:hypothetical protein